MEAKTYEEPENQAVLKELPIIELSYTTNDPEMTQHRPVFKKPLSCTGVASHSPQQAS